MPSNPTGYYHTFNTLKYRIMSAAFSLYPKPFTANDVARITGLESARISKALTHYHVHNLHYFRRLKVKAPDQCHRYILNKKGKKTYISLIRRIKLGFDLNLKKHTPIKMETYAGIRNIKIKSIEDLSISPEEIKPYIRLTSQGEHNIGLKKENLLEIAGIVKDSHNEPEMIEEPEVTEVSERREELKVPEMPEKPVLLPSKIYTIKGEQMSSKEMAEVLQFGINKINAELKSTADVNKIKKLQDKKRVFLMLVHYNPDIKQYIK